MLKLLTLLLTLILPLQGIAAAFAPLHKALNPAANMPCHEHLVDDQRVPPQQAQTALHQAAVSQAPAPDAPREADAANHFCCHQIFTCATACTPATPAHKFSDVLNFMLPLATLFIPDSPDRPPRG